MRTIRALSPLLKERLPRFKLEAKLWQDFLKLCFKFLSSNNLQLENFSGSKVKRLLSVWVKCSFQVKVLGLQ